MSGQHSGGFRPHWGFYDIPTWEPERLQNKGMNIIVSEKVIKTVRKITSSQGESQPWTKAIVLLSLDIFTRADELAFILKAVAHKGFIFP